jgi:chromosome segregation protein
MFLEKLEIQGFKSFANKNLLVFPGLLAAGRRGLTAIVGPNGSGKSNVADAVRWVLGEQSMKTLRGKKSEDVIFSGSVKLGRLGMAEVSLFLNNESGQAPLDYSQIVLTRRLYRDGASEYLINGSRARLIDIQIMLAKANFGQRTYSVIGQGMVEGFLNTSLAERKEFFDEATGIKQYQIKRDEALNKLLLSYENLGQANMILMEIEPRLRSLTKQVNRLQRRGELENELRELSLTYYRKLWHEINDKFGSQNKNYLELEKVKQEKEKKLAGFNQKLTQLERQKSGSENFAELQTELSKLQNQKDLLNKQIARLDAQLELKLEASGQFDLSWLKNKREELSKEKKMAGEEQSLSESALNQLRSLVETIKGEQNDVSQKIKELSQELLKASAGPGKAELSLINNDLKKLFSKLETAELEADLGQVRMILAEIKSDLSLILEVSARTEGGENLAQIQIKLNELTEKRERLSLAANEKNLVFFSQNERLKNLNEKTLNLDREMLSIESKLKARTEKIDFGDTAKERQNFQNELSVLEEKTAAIKAEVAVISQKESLERSQLFELQKNSRDLSDELSNLSRELNEIKINSTRYETRLEDLEQEIRRELGGLKEVREVRLEGLVELEPLGDKIHALKRQLDQIGGIDPEVEKEYLETKERHDFLSGQTGDLEKTIESLETVIKELDVVIKERFDKEFKIISEKFEEYFKILFSGGQSKIIKVMEGEEEEIDGEPKPDVEEKKPLSQAEDDKLAKIKRIKYLQKHNATGLAGIEIQATPPGKKIKSIAMLSGGERALTAIALICAIINVNPSPFVVLDEVDAALDEANSERLAKILDDLSHKSQFIVITHNRASMRRANVLYGVTMGEDGVSKLLSVKLDEAEAKLNK